MSRRRMIDPHIWEDPSFNLLSVGARLLFIGMISNADDEGYFRADSGCLKRTIFGFDEFVTPELMKWLEEINKMNSLHFYDNNGEKYAHFIKWGKYQKQQKDRIVETTYPVCSICLASDKQVLTEVKLSKDNRSKVKEIEDSGTPAHQNKLFFEGKDVYSELLVLFTEGNDPVYVEQEFKRFILYWTEPNRSGTRVRWETEQTFDVKRRLYTWLSRSKDYKLKEVTKENKYLVGRIQ